MGVHECPHVERLEAREQGAPENRHEAGGDKQLRKPRQLIMGQLAARRRLRKSRAHHREHARDDLLIVELGKLGEARPLRQDQINSAIARTGRS